MRKSNVALLVVFFVCIPFTLYLGQFFTGRGYYITSTLIVAELLIPFFMLFENKKPQARELVVIAVMCAIAVIARVAIPIPHFKPAFAVMMLSGIALGPEIGFMVGAVAAFASNFFYGQGPYLPWQMMAYGAGGMLAGFAFQKNRLPQKKWTMSIFGFLTVIFWIGPLLDCSHLFLMMPEINQDTIIASLISGFPVNFSQAVSTVITILLFGRPLLDKLDRIKQKYGMMEADNGI